MLGLKENIDDYTALRENFFVPSPYSDDYFKAIYGENHENFDEFMSVFGCPSENGNTVECREKMALWYNSFVQGS